MIMCQFIHARLKIEKIMVYFSSSDYSVKRAAVMCYRIILLKLPAAN